MRLIYCFVLALAAAALLTPAVMALARRMGWVVAPRQDRWHRRPTAIYGGVAIYLAFMLSWLFLGGRSSQDLVLVVCAGAMFLVGLADDIFELKPQVKFLAQLLVATVAVALGLRFDFIAWTWLNVPFTLLWLVGVTNAVNILDNMDGLSSGVTLSAGTILALVAAVKGAPQLGCPPPPWPEPRRAFSSTTSTRPKFSWATAAACSWASAWPVAPCWGPAAPAT